MANRLLTVEEFELRLYESVERVVASMEDAQCRLKAQNELMKDLIQQWRRLADENEGIDSSAYFAYARCADELSELFIE